MVAGCRRQKRSIVVLLMIITWEHAADHFPSFDFAGKAKMKQFEIRQT